MIKENCLSNTLKLLQYKKELNVLFMGGSVTDGHKSSNPKEKGWPKLICNWLSEKYGAKVNEYRKSIGGTTSYYAAFRYDKEVSVVPDLFFIEFAINDGYAKYSYDFITKTSETLVRTALKANPNVDIVYVLTFDRSVKTRDYNSLCAHRDVAEKYGFECIKLSDTFYKLLENEDKTDEDYIPDGVHPNDDGYYRYFEIIRDALDKRLSNTVIDGDELIEKALPEPMTDYYKNHKLLTAREIYNDDNNGWIYETDGNLSWLGNRYDGILSSTQVGSKFIFEFEGTDLGLVCESNTDIGKISFKLDDGEEQIIDAKLTYSNPKVIVLSDALPFGKHKAEFTLLEEKFKIGALFVN